ncbi:ATP-dependent helicase [Nakamurella lactea]|uniref:ATP-dependent helicase n=1 Tax=Nakamurella lactea TaxID=459515 RepID=UPI000685E51B|nr:ATP-dependent DNA helicase [Nakamurella lactea]
MTASAATDQRPGSTGVRYRLRRPGGGVGVLVPSTDQRQVIEHAGGRLRVLAGPGTGKTATIVEAVAQRVEARGVDPESVLVLTFSRRAARELTDRITRRLGVTTAEPLVRTLHSYAYALLKAEAARSGAPAPRMLGAAESDRMVADLLAGQLAQGGMAWPGQLRPALASRAFAGEVRDLVLRTGERALSPAAIAALGRRYRRPEWVAAAGLAKEYQQVVDLRMGTTGLGTALDQAELTLAALELLSRDDVLAVEQRRIRRVFVDEYQDVDPAQAALVERLAAGADELVLVGDPDQAIYGFRGADPGALRRIEVDRTVTLSVSRRAGLALLTATRRVAALLPGTADHRELFAADGVPAGVVEIRVLPTAAREAAYVADRLRRAHLIDGVPWSEMAVVVRSPAAALPALRRAFATSGVPLAVPPADRGALGDPLADTLIRLLQFGADPQLLDGAMAQQLLTAPLGGAGGLDALALRRLRRAARLAAAAPDQAPAVAADQVPTERPAGAPGSTADLLAELLASLVREEDEPRWLADLPEARTVRRLAGLLRAAQQAAAAADGESALWRVWTGTGLQSELTTAAERGGRAGRRADEALDAVVALFDQAAELAARLPGAGVRAFIDQALSEQLPGERSARAGRAGEVVTVLSAHAAKGLEWDLVAVAAVQEGSWPDLRTRTGLLATEDLLDRAADIDPALSRTPAMLADERRLFYVACTRARRELLVTASSGEDRAPSRFLDELAGTDSEGGQSVEQGWPRDGAGTRRAFHLPELVGELRRAVSSSTDPEVRQQAAAQLARLAAAGVPGAHPRQWYALAGVSSDAPAVPSGTAVAVSPSAVERLQQCSLRGVLERRGARGPIEDPQLIGMVVHAAAQGLSQGMSEPAVVAEIDTFLAGQEQLPDWQVRRIRRAVTSMTTAIAHWLDQQAAAGARTVGSELTIDLDLGTARMTGRIDHLGRQADGTLLVTDFKTSVTPESKEKAARNLQLACYQVAVTLGGVDGVDGESGGAQLLYVRSGSANPRPQPPLDPELAELAVGAIRESAARLAGATLLAQENADCDRCPVRSCCPLQSEGRQVTR